MAKPPPVATSTSCSPFSTVPIAWPPLLTTSVPRSKVVRLAVAPAETANCPLWLRFLNEATGGDQELIQFLRQFLGYCLMAT